MIYHASIYMDSLGTRDLPQKQQTTPTHKPANPKAFSFEGSPENQKSLGRFSQASILLPKRGKSIWRRINRSTPFFKAMKRKGHSKKLPDSLGSLPGTLKRTMAINHTWKGWPVGFLSSSQPAFWPNFSMAPGWFRNTRRRGSHRFPTYVANLIRVAP